MAKTTEMVEVAVSLLKPYANNAKKHGEDQIEKLKASITEFGFLSPCLIDRDYNLIAGHGRVMAAKELGLEKVPCIFIEGLTEDQRKAYILADNKLGELGEWDMELVESELKALNEAGFDTLVTGFDFDLDIDTGDFNDDNPYTDAVNIPQYEPSDEEVTLGDLFDTRKYDELLADIDEADIPKGEKEFLKLAATRHIVFNYKRVADYYAKATPEMQEQMEKSALVIIDVEDAIKYGYAHLRSYLDEIEERENGDAE